MAAACAGILLATGPFADGEDAAARTFTNPVIESGADPWVVRRDGFYYLCQSRGGSVWVARSPRLSDLGRVEARRVWTPPEGRPYSKSLWAPELHFLAGTWWIYVAADDGDNANHRMYVLEGGSEDPLHPFRFRGKIAPPEDRPRTRQSGRGAAPIYRGSGPALPDVPHPSMAPPRGRAIASSSAWHRSTPS